MEKKPKVRAYGIPPPSVLHEDAPQISRGKPSYHLCISARFIKHSQSGWRALLSRASSPRRYHTSYPVRVPRPLTFVSRCLQTPPRGDALALPLSFGSTHTWTGDLHPRA